MSGCCWHVPLEQVKQPLSSLLCQSVCQLPVPCSAGLQCGHSLSVLSLAALCKPSFIHPDPQRAELVLTFLNLLHQVSNSCLWPHSCQELHLQVYKLKLGVEFKDQIFIFFYQQTITILPAPSVCFGMFMGDGLTLLDGSSLYYYSYCSSFEVIQT